MARKRTPMKPIGVEWSIQSVRRRVRRDIADVDALSHEISTTIMEVNAPVRRRSTMSLEVMVGVLP